MSTASPVASELASTPGRQRIELFDGLRGIAILLVVLSHGWTLWPTDWVDSHWLVRPLFRSGNTAVTVFLVTSGFLTFRTLSGHAGLVNMRPGVTLLRRVLRVGPSLWLMLLVLMLVATIDSTDETSRHDNVDSVLHVLTYTWNWYVQGNLLTSRPDFGHLWYLSVEMQSFVILTVLLYAMRRRTAGLALLLGGFYLLLTWWRFHVTDVEFVFQVLVRTTARMDAFVIGVLAAVCVPLLARLTLDPRHVSRVTLALLTALLPLVWWCAADPQGHGDSNFLGWGGTLLQLAFAGLMASVSLGGVSLRSTELFSRPRLVFLGRNSLLIYIWHYPVFVFVQRHTDEYVWPARAAIALAMTIVVCVAAHLLLERRVSRLLQQRWWRRLDNGLAPYGRELVRRRIAPSRAVSKAP